MRRAGAVAGASRERWRRAARGLRAPRRRGRRSRARRRRGARRCRGRGRENRLRAAIAGSSRGGRCTGGGARRVGIVGVLLWCRRGIRCICLLRRRSGVVVSWVGFGKRGGGGTYGAVEDIFYGVHEGFFAFHSESRRGFGSELCGCCCSHLLQVLWWVWSREFRDRRGGDESE